ncbi:MAG TPA: porin [bacterium]|nr:porin [bacterium]
MYRFSVIALAVGAMALFGMAKPGHAEVKVSGVAWAGIGIHKTTPKTGDGATDIRADSLGEINFTGGVGNVTGKVRYRVRGEQDAAGTASKTPAAVRHQVDWKVSDSLDIVFMGQSFGIPDSFVGYSETTLGVFTSQGDIGDMIASPQFFFVNRGGVDVRAGSGGVEYGIAVIGSCAPACGGVTDQAQTIIPHVMVKAGGITAAVYYAAASGKDLTTKATPKANEVNLGLAYHADNMQFGFQYVQDKDNPNSYKYTGMALGGKVGAIGFHYNTQAQEDAAGTKTTDLNEIAFAYTVPLTEQAEFILGVAQDQDKLAETKDLLVLASAKTTF